MSYGIKAYRSVGVKDDLAVADPHRVIQLLMQGALENMAKAKGAIERKDFAGKAQTLAKAIAIISSLQGSLDMDAGGELSDNLFSLYDFMLNHLTIASRDLDIEKIDDVISLMVTIKSAWDQISVADREKGYSLQGQRDQQMVVGI
ncbi:flagellar export chaperone FliS [Alishewanella sp. 16-MA]|uniref:Flagellar secretion chaperone FliS n=1 Tax=Alishewanella maricola TaxID=2795740 RepID=A0ABS8C5X4_9ALTE|nr:flagellar export chaperone FliS [Alishewanella maricola]MCB5227746.1 flagellar export chaperone FliS [Alishewanella maricola]